MPFFGPPGGSAAGGAPTFTAPETVARADRLVLSAKLADTHARADRLVIPAARLADTIARTDAYRIPSASIKAPDTIARADLARFLITWDVTPRSGTPDLDAWGDAWTDAAIGQTGVNHGNATPLAFTNGVLGARVGFVEIDMTRFSASLIAVGDATGTHVFRHYLFNSDPLLPITATLSFYAQAGRWFTESTITQANQPNPSPALFTKSISVPAGGTPVGSPDWCSLLASEMQQLLGKWVLVKFTSPALSVGPITVASREGAGTPFTFFFFVQR